MHHSQQRRTPQPIVDPNGVAYIHLAGRPASSIDYLNATRSAYSALQTAARDLRFTARQNGRHGRGAFPAVTVGISSGNGHSVCTRRPAKPYPRSSLSFLSRSLIISAPTPIKPRFLRAYSRTKTSTELRGLQTVCRSLYCRIGNESDCPQLPSKALLATSTAFTASG